MASIFDDLPTNPNRLGSTEYSFYDADTLYDKEGRGYRLQGVNTLEVDTLGKEGQGDIGGDLTTEQVVKLANDLGYTTLVGTGVMDATGEREVADLRNAAGQSFARELAASGLGEATAKYDLTGDLTKSRQIRNAMKTTEGYELNDFDKAAQLLEDHLADNNANTLRFKQKRMLPGMQSDVYVDHGAMFERPGVISESGKSTSQWGGTAWDVSMTGVAEALYGTSSLMGEKLGIDSLKNWGEAGVYGARSRIKDHGSILTDYKDVNGFTDALKYISNNAVMSLPYMGITAAGVGLTAMTGGAAAPIAMAGATIGFGTPASVYAGQVWNEMGDQAGREEGDRSAAYAIGAGVMQAALDRLGLKGIASGGSKEMFAAGVAALVAKGISKEAAEGMVINASKRELAMFIGDAAKVAREQVVAKQLTMDTINRMAKGAGFEAATEASQEAIAAIAADLGSDQVIDWRDVSDRMIQGAVAGGALGGAFGGAGAIKDAGAWANIAWGTSLEDPNMVSKSAQYAREEENKIISEVQRDANGNIIVDADGDPVIVDRKRGYVPTIQEETAKIDNMPEALEPTQSRKQRAEENRKKRTTSQVLFDALMSVPALWRGAVRYAIPPEVQEQSRTARVLADMFNGNLQRIFGGSSYENYKHHLVSTYRNMVDDPEAVFTAMNDGKPLDSKLLGNLREQLSQNFYNEAMAAIDANGNIDYSKITGEPAARAAKIRLINQMQKLADKMYKDQVKYNPNLGKLKNYLLKYRALNKKAVAKDRAGFIEKLMKNFPWMDRQTATMLTDDIINGTSNTAEEAFSVIKGGPKPGSHKSRTLNLSEHADFTGYMEQDVFANIAKAAKSSARYVGNQEFVGDNASKIAKLLDQMEREGVDRGTVDEIARRMTNYLDAESGNYKRPKSEMGKRLQAVQKNFMLFVTLTGLPLAVFSSIVELALTTRGLTKDQIFGKNGGISAIAREGANMLYNGMVEVANTATAGKANLQFRETEGTKILKKAGYYDWDVGAATTTGVTETHEWHTKILESFFKWTGLQGWTNYTRAVRASIAGDYIVDNAMIVMDWQGQNLMNGTQKTNEVREAEDKLRNLGIDITRDLPDMVAVLSGRGTPEMERHVGSRIKEATFNFVNEAVVMPQSGNRPLIYQDPRFALFMQFQGFMSTFTANHIPRLWSEYVANGSPQMKYNTFAMMVTMIGLGFASQYLKDLIKYGGDNPYLDESEIIQRGIRASGLLGTGERVLDQFFPLYETRSNGPGEWLFNTATGESPTLSKAKQLGGATSDIISGDYERAGNTLLKAGLGPVKNPITSGVQWLFNGE